MAKLHVRKGDLVEVLVGDQNEKGKRAKVVSTFPKTGRVLVDGSVFTSKKSVKPRNAQEKGGIVDKPRSVDASNVILVCTKCSKTTRNAHKIVDGKSVRVCKKCGAIIESAKYTRDAKSASQAAAKEVKTAKKAADKQAKAAKKTATPVVDAE